MIFKYYTYNMANSEGQQVGGYVVRAWFFSSPLSVMGFIRKDIEDGYGPVNLRRIK